MKLPCWGLLFVALWSRSQSQEENELNVRRIMREMEVMPEILDEAPKDLLRVKFDNAIDIEEGKTYTPKELKFQPKLDWNADPEAFYTVMMICPDAPNRQNPMYRSWLHWLVVNVPGLDVTKGQPISDYFGPLPPRDSGLQRYLILVYQQSDRLDFDEKPLELGNAEGHSNFDVSKFTQKYEMGSPVAGNILQSKWDEYVPELMKMLYGVGD
ncbi:putative odorant-binding protein A5 [Drosophila pseudoobscura]|uniref:Odorant-binding protein A5 n=1 Tax=Drosophila pseudoobscura pseudoobscura TaxID=46245 RepID=A0A6I8UKR9_DROPS|nr:putative odorant-binding protein A5 [Drosophila pseudoobscura]